MKKKILFIAIAVAVFIIIILCLSCRRNTAKKDNTNTNGSEEIISNDNEKNNKEDDSNTENDNSNEIESNSNSSSNKTSNSATKSNSSTNKQTSNNGNKKTVEQQVNELMSSLTLEEKIGQMLIIENSNSSMTSSFKSTLKQIKPGGFILFKSNITSYTKTLQLVKDIKATSNIPMFISIDQEGGKVQRLSTLTDATVTIVPPMLTVGQKNDTTIAYNVGKVLARELRTLGINLDFAPTIDVVTNPNNNVIGNRSFGSDKNVVANMGINVGKGLLDNGVIPVYKHFPGHGSTAEDSHYDLPVITKTKQELLDSDIYPFKKAISSGAKIIMIGHLAVPNITGDKTPASLSKVLITNLLKKELGYNGLVVTDALNMGALTKNYSEQQIYEMAINAGVDILLMPKNPSNAIKYIKDSVNKGKISKEQIDQSVRKILTLKYQIIPNYVLLSKSTLNCEEHKKIIKSIN